MLSKGKIKLIYVVNGRIPNERANGIQIVNTCEALGATGADLTLVTPIFFGEKETLQKKYGIKKTFKHVRIFAIDIPFGPLQFFIRSWTFFLSVNIFLLYLYMVSFVTREKVVIYARGEVIFSLLPISFLVPTFFETHQIRNYPNLYKIALKRVKGIVVITDRLKKKFIEEYGIAKEKILVARDSVNLQKFSEVDIDKKIWLKHGINIDKKIILYTGTLGKEKGVDTLALSSPCVSQDTQIVFIGGNQEQADAFREKYKAYKNISALGYVEHELIPKYIAAADVLILPDLSTDTYANLFTSPMKLFEYMASGRVIVASDIPSLREVLTEDSCLFFESGNEKSLAAKILVALNDNTGSERLGKKAQEIVSHFTWTKRGDAIINHVFSLMGYKK